MIPKMSCFIFFESLFLSKLSLLYCRVAFLTRRLERNVTRNGREAVKTRIPVIRNAYWILVSPTVEGAADNIARVEVTKLPSPDWFKVVVVFKVLSLETSSGTEIFKNISKHVCTHVLNKKPKKTVCMYFRKVNMTIQNISSFFLQFYK